MKKPDAVGPNTTILGLGAYIPEEVRTNDFWPEWLVQKWQSNRLGRVLRFEKREEGGEFRHPILREELEKIGDDPFFGMKERRVARVSPAAMEIAACREALQDADLGPEDIDLLVGFSLPTNRIILPNAYRVHHELGLKNAMCFEMSAICHSFLMMVETVSQYIATGRVRNAMIFVSTQYSSLMDYTSSLSVAAGDGAAAVVLGRCEPGQGFLARTHGFETQFYEVMFPRRRLPSHPEATDFDYGPGTNRENVYFTLHDPVRAQEVMARIPYWGEKVRDEFLHVGWKPEDTDLMVTNAAMVWYSPVLSRIFDVPMTKVVDNVTRFSNMGAVNLPMNLYTAYKSGKIHDGHNILMFGHGGGAGYGGALLKWNKRPSL